MATNELAKTEKENPKTKILSSKSDTLVNMGERTLWETGVDPQTQFNPWNPDDIYQKAGDYSIYEDMMDDDQISVAMAIKKDLIIGAGWHFKCESDEDEDVRRDLEKSFREDFHGSFDDSLYEIISAYDFGFSITEKQFDTRDDNSLFLSKLKTRNPVNWLFHQDIFGNIVRYEQQGTQDKRFDSINPNSIIHFVNNPRFGNPYGRSDLRAAYAAYFIKKQIVRYYAIFLEKAASPTPVAKYDKNVAEDKDIQKIHDAIKRFQVSTAMTIPKEFEIDFVEAKGDGEAYIKGISLFNMFIGRSLFVPDLLGFQGGPTTGGSQALGREQMVIFFKHIMRRRRTLESIVNRHLVEPIVRWNYGELDHFPKFKLNPIEPDQAERHAELWLKAVQSRAYRPSLEDINHFKKIIEFPESEEEELEADPIEDFEPPKETEEIAEDLEPKVEFAAKPFGKPPGDFHKKVDFKAIETQLDASLENAMTKLKPAMKEAIAALESDLMKKRVNQEKGLAKLDNIRVPKPKLNKIQRILGNELKRVFAESGERARKEIQKSDFKIDVDKFAVQPAEEFIKTLEAENFNFIKDWEYELSKGARVAAIQAVKDGAPISSVIEFVGEEAGKKASVSMERYARTKSTEVMNKGRIEFFKQTDIVAGYQYSAILDGRTTTICSGLHGKKFKAGTEPVPPMHFNCRSVLIPITMFEEFSEDTKVGKRNIDEFIDSEKGKGFPKQ